MAAKRDIPAAEVTKPPAASGERAAVMELRQELARLGFRPSWEFHQRMERGGFYVLGGSIGAVSVIVQEYYDLRLEEQDNVTSAAVFVPLSAGTAETIKALRALARR